MVTYTPVLKLTQPDFDQTPWDEDINNDLAILDAAYGKLAGIDGLTGAWKNATAYTVGQSAVDGTTSTLWKCAVAHTSAASPTTFAQDRTAHPTYWTSSGALLVYLPITGGTLTGSLGISTPAGVARVISVSTNASPRWAIELASADPETGSNAGSNFQLLRYSDTGAFIDHPIDVDRKTGNIGFNNPVFMQDNVTSPAYYITSTGGYITGDANYTEFVQDAGLWRWQYNRSNGLMQWVRGPDNTQLLGIDGTGNVAILGTLTIGNLLAFGNTAGYITGDTNVVEFVFDANAWRLQYTRQGAPTGILQYVRGSDNQVLFQIDGAGAIYSHGSYYPNSVMSLDGTVVSKQDRFGELEARVAALEAKIENS